jgi:hypothetical protein
MRGNRSGHAFVEIAFFLPWIFFAFVGAFDYGFYAYALISTQSAARAGALYTSSATGMASSSEGACSYALDELRRLPNVGNAITSCGSYPVIVGAASVTGPDGAAASTVTVTYQTPRLIPVPGLIPGRVTITRAVEMRVKG